MTRPNPAQIVGGLLLLLVVSLLSAELLRALGSEACPAPDCYPWGAEGSAAGAWSYASKANYLLRGSAQLALLLAAGCSSS